MTAQVPDIIVWEGIEYLLHSEPLESFFDKKNPKPNFAQWGMATCCWRGYVAEWEIREKRLYLKEVRPFDQFDVSLINIVFPHLEPPIPALWYTGKLYLESGDLVEYVHGGYASTYEREDVLLISKGLLLNS